MRVQISVVVLAAALGAVPAVSRVPEPPLEPEASARVEQTLAGMTVDEKVAQLVSSSFLSTFLSTDTAEFERARQPGAPRRGRLSGVRRP